MSKLKHAFKLSLFLFAIWLLLSGHYTPLLLVLGVLSTLLVVLLATRAALGVLTLSSAQLARGNVAPLVAGQPASMPGDDFNTADLLLITSKATGVMNF